MARPRSEGVKPSPARSGHSHFRPQGVGMPRALRASAMARNVFAPLFWDVRRMAVCVGLEGRCAGFTGR